MILRSKVQKPFKLTMICHSFYETVTPALRLLIDIKNPENERIISMKKELFPKAVLKLLKENGIEEDDIFVASATDMNTECLYADGFVVITLKQLAIVLSAPEKEAVHSFKGYMTRQKSPDELVRDWSLKIYPLEKVENLKAEPQVACSLLVADVDGVTLRLTAFSNLYKREMHKLVRTFDKICMETKAFGSEEKE